MNKLRSSVVQYLNTAPLVRGFTHGPLQGKYDLSFTVPSLCADALRTGAADIAIIPAIEYQRIPNLVILPDLSIASKERVRSLLVVSREPIRRAKQIALDRSSRSTQAFTKILCANRWNISPEFREADPDVAAMLAESDAALLIGDPALRRKPKGTPRLLLPSCKTRHHRTTQPHLHRRSHRRPRPHHRLLLGQSSVKNVVADL